MDDSPLSDEAAAERDELVKRSAEGDSAALRMLLLETRVPLRNRMARNIPADLQAVLDVEDVIQETQLDVFRRINEFEFNSCQAFERWLERVAMSRLRDAIRRYRAAKRGGQVTKISGQETNEEASTVALFATLMSDDETPSKIVRRAEAARAVQEVLDTMPEHYCRAVRLVYIEGHAAREAASVMGKSERAIHGLCRRGLQMLRDRLRRQYSSLSWSR